MQIMMVSLVLALVAAPPAPGLEANGDGTLTDSRTGLTWTRQDNAEDVTWRRADEYCQELELGGHSDWRLPTIEELAGLYQPEVEGPGTYRYRDKDYPLRIDPLFQLTAPGVWSAAKQSERPLVAWSFFYSSGKRLASRGSFSNYQRALCVRLGHGKEGRQ